VQVGLKESEEADRIDARIAVKEAKPWNYSLSWANTGSSATGNDRFTVSGSHANLFDRDHGFTGAYTTSLERPSDVRQLGLNYRIPLYRQGGVLGLSYTRSDVVGNFGTFSSTGAGETMGVNFNYYLPPDGGYRSYFGISLDEKVFNATQINGVAVQSPRRSRPLTLGYNARVESDTAVWGYNTDLAFNLGGGSDNSLAAYTTEDARITSTSWKALRGGGHYLTTFAGGWLVSFRGQFQFSPDALISGEQFGLGGATSIRGTGERPLSGDSGVLAITEISTRELAPGLRLMGFIDAGWLANNNPNGNPKPANDSLASAGLGLRFNSPSGYSISAEYGRVISGSQLPFVPGSNIPQAGDQKFHINFTARF
jgi:hemolysin activation/secretion protein